MIKIRKGLDLPIAGAPEQKIYQGKPVQTLALMGREHVGMKPTMLVTEGDRVRLGQTLFTDKKNPGVNYTAPGTGVVEAIHRGAKRVFHSLVIRLEGDEQETFAAYGRDELDTLNTQQIKDNLLASGLWTAFRTRPYGKTPAPASTPHSIFVTAMDSRPLAPRADLIINESPQDFMHGLTVLTKLSGGPVFVCQYPEAQIATPDHSAIRVEAFSGPHPSGLPGTHIHFLDPVSAGKTVWYLNYQDVIAFGRLFTTGRLDVERIIAIAGPPVLRPRLIRTRLGANTQDLVEDELQEVECRIISGSIFAGYRAAGWASFLGRFNHQITVLREGREREFFGWFAPGKDKFSMTNVFISSLLGNRRKFNFTTSQNGSPRAMVPIGVYEDVMPLDILPTQLLRALLVRDTDMAQALGCLELDEEDLALCTFVCPSKYEYGPVLRDNLEQIHKEG